MYDPMVPLDAVKTLEPDYLAVIDEWAAQPVPTDPRLNARKLMRQSKTLPELIAALEGLL